MLAWGTYMLNSCICPPRPMLTYMSLLACVSFREQVPPAALLLPAAILCGRLPLTSPHAASILLAGMVVGTDWRSTGLGGGKRQLGLAWKLYFTSHNIIVMLYGRMLSTTVLIPSSECETSLALLDLRKGEHHGITREHQE